MVIFLIALKERSYFALVEIYFSPSASESSRLRRPNEWKRKEMLLLRTLFSIRTRKTKLIWSECRSFKKSLRVKRTKMSPQVFCLSLNTSEVLTVAI